MTAAVVGFPGGSAPKATADTPPAPDAPTITLRDAIPAVAGVDYEVLAWHTNKNLDRANGQYFDGVTDDGLLYRDGPHGLHNTTRWGLLDPATSDLDWLPDPDLGDNQAFPLVLGADRLLLAPTRAGSKAHWSRTCSTATPARWSRRRRREHRLLPARTRGRLRLRPRHRPLPETQRGSLEVRVGRPDASGSVPLGHAGEPPSHGATQRLGRLL